ncbi:MAG: TIGR00730 family Rossman fold protein [Alphaproteobacteria bacterium]|nr:TIGR00730 family Rossman fold protein [Alphaproteobacteria bacterium]
MAIHSVCVFCGSRTGTDHSFQDSADRFGRILAKKGIRLVFGAGSIGLMGILARAALDEGGEVLGVIPEHLAVAEIPQFGLSEMRIVDTMHERKRIMFEESDGFVILPGGIGTLDEMVEIIVWRQLSVHDKPVVVVNLNGFWDPFIELLQHMIDAQFVGPNAFDLFKVVDDLEDALPAIEAASPPAFPSSGELT